MYVYFLNFLCVQLKVPQKSKPGEFITFRKILLTRCQQEFEKDKDDLLDLEKMQAAIDAATTVRTVFHCL